MRMSLRPTLALPALLLLAACGGGGGGSTPQGPTQSTTLAYTDPTGTGWRLVKDPSSSPSHLVLNLVGPTGGANFGVAFTATTDATQAPWAKVTSGDAEFARNLTYTLGSGSTFFKTQVQTHALVAGLFQKGVGGTPTPTGAPVLQVALSLGTGVAPGTVIPLSVTGSQELTASGMAPITIAVGTLKAQ
jgi:hypothetical protein